MDLRVILIAALSTVISGMVNAEPVTESEREFASGHPRPSYAGVGDIDAMASALRKQMAGMERQSFSRSWWKWDRLRARYVDGGRVRKNELKILDAVFRAWIFDWHDKLVAKGEGDLFYIFFVTTAPGNKTVRKLGDRELVRDWHGGGYHGGWGGAARMRIYEELANSGMLTALEKQRFKEIVHQSMSPKFLDFTRGSQKADNHSYGNGGGIAMALKLFPDVPQAAEAKAWLDRIWDGSLKEFGDWKEWTYYPYGPIFLHGMLDIAEATGRIKSDAELVNTVGSRVLAFNHGGGVKGNPNSGSRVRKDRAEIYADPWNVGYFEVETSARDGHFWYRMARHYEDPLYLWAAEQVVLGGRPSFVEATLDYKRAYGRRFEWFVKRRMQAWRPAGGTAIGYLSPEKHKIPERLYLSAGRMPGKPFAAFFLYDQKDAHLDNISGHLYEYSFGGAKLLHTSGKYNSLGKGGGTGEESLDLLLVLHKKHAFPIHPDGGGDEQDFVRRGFIRHLPDFLVAEANEDGDAFGRFAFDDYYGEGSRWTRRAVLTKEGYLVIADEYRPGKGLGGDYRSGPVWHLAPNAETKDGPTERNWFDAPAIDHAWWKQEPMRVMLYFHDGGKLEFGQLRQSHSQDVDANVTTFASRPVAGGKTERFLSVFVPYAAGKLKVEELAESIKTSIEEVDGTFRARVGETGITIGKDTSWSVSRE